jgi:SAM-dependent methyltransferase
MRQIDQRLQIALTSILRDVKDRHDEDWEDLARREPYFAVLTSEGSPGVEGSRIATAAFLDTGEEDIASLLSAITSLLGRDMAMGSALDFGCGAGRLTLPLAQRFATVVACDVAPTMLNHARQNIENTGLRNVTFVGPDLLAELPPRHFDFVCSLLVFQYIRPATGYQIIRTLLDLLAPGGVAALHLTFGLPNRSLRQLARWTRGRSRLAPDATGALSDEKRLPSYAQMNEFEERVVQRRIEAAGARLAGRFATNQGDTPGAVLVIQKP